MAGRARTTAGLLGLLVSLVIVAAAVTALPPAAGAAAPLQRSTRSTSSSAAEESSPAPVIVVLATVRPLAHPSRPHLPSSAAENRSSRPAFRAASLAGQQAMILLVLVVPAQGPRAPPCNPEATDRFAVAGGDPVNGGDPTGLTDAEDLGVGGSDWGGRPAGTYGAADAGEGEGAGGSAPSAGGWYQVGTLEDGSTVWYDPATDGYAVVAPAEPTAEEIDAASEMARGAACRLAAEGNAAADGELTPFSENNLGHIFRDAPGHFSDDTPENRLLLQNAVSPDNYVRTNPVSGVATYHELLPDGQQVWVEVRNGVITNGGIDAVPRP